MLNSKVNKLFFISWLRKVGALTFCTFLSQLLMAVNFFIIAFYFGQDQLGQISVLIAWVTIISVVNLLGYNILIPQIEDKYFYDMIRAVCIILLLFTLVLYFILTIYNQDNYLYIVLYSFALGLNNISEMKNIRDKSYNRLALWRILPSIFIFIGLIALVINNSYALSSLIFLYTIIILLTSIVYFITSIPVDIYNSLSLNRLIKVLLANKESPKYIATSNLLNNVSYNLPVIIIEKLFTTALAAQYSLVLRFCFGPVNLIGGNIAKVFHGEMADKIRSKSDGVQHLFFQNRKILLYMAVIISFGIGFVFPTFIYFTLGESWHEAILISVIFAPLFGIMLYVSSLTGVLYLFNEYKFLFSAQSILLLIMVGSFSAGYLLHSFWLSIILYSVLSCARYLLINYKILKIIYQSK